MSADVPHREGPSHPVRRAAAFTLIELLVVAAILGLVIGAIAACLGGGLKAWDAAHRFNATEADAMAAMRIFQRDVANALLLFDVGCKGNESAVYFPVVGVTPAEAPVDGRTSERQRILGVRYALEAGVFVREARAVTLDEETPSSPVRETLVRGLGGLRFDYRSAGESGSGAGGWVSGWDSVTNLPSAVRLSLDVPGSGAFTRTVVLPLAAP